MSTPISQDTINKALWGAYDTSRGTISADTYKEEHGNEPELIAEMMNAIGKFMGATDMPVLLMYANPGLVVPPKAVGWYINKIQKLETAFLGQGLHFIQEDQPEAIGRALADWMRRH
ncbi:MAG: hypothetical protein L3K25_07390 [Gammaproteobacteria bacterium]|nr:hypothetical protein [Gammaproteobacteria bacterium]